MSRFIFPILSAILFLSSCTHTISDTPIITVSIEPLRYFVESIGGDRLRVNTLVPAGVSPETYELTPQQVVEISESKVYFCVGTLGFEKTRLEQLTRNTPNLITVNVSDSIPLIISDEVCNHDQDDAHGHSHSDGIDLHTWPSTSSGRQIAKNILRALITVDTLNADYYTARYDSLITHIDSLDTQIRTTLKDVQHRTFLIYHPALGYFARDFGLRQMSVEQDGKEPSVERMQQLISQSKAEGIRVIFIQEEHSGRSARRIAEAIGGRVVSCAPLSHEWDKQLLHIARSLAQ